MPVRGQRYGSGAHVAVDLRRVARSGEACLGERERVPLAAVPFASTNFDELHLLEREQHVIEEREAQGEDAGDASSLQRTARVHGLENQIHRLRHGQTGFLQGLRRKRDLALGGRFRLDRRRREGFLAERVEGGCSHFWTHASGSFSVPQCRGSEGGHCATGSNFQRRSNWGDGLNTGSGELQANWSPTCV